jgi:hypothetical protein
MKKTTKKLTLKKATIKLLALNEEKLVAGGATRGCSNNSCPGPASNPCCQLTK